MIPLYILGLLLRFGPQHGYQIKKLIEEQLADFTQIKLPTVYYHLEKMQGSGLLIAHSDKQGARPEKTVYHVGEAGEKQFKELLLQTLDIQYRPSFEIDGTFYFSDYLTDQDLLNSLARHADKLRHTLDILAEHREDSLSHIPQFMQISAGIIFAHHIMHYQTELAWAEDSMKKIKEAEHHEESKNR